MWADLISSHISQNKKKNKSSSPLLSWRDLDPEMSREKNLPKLLGFINPSSPNTLLEGTQNPLQNQFQSKRKIKPEATILALEGGSIGGLDPGALDSWDPLTKGIVTEGYLSKNPNHWDPNHHFTIKLIIIISIWLGSRTP